MIRSSRIPPVLSRICGGGIHAALLITMDGELLGSYQDPDHEGFSEKNMSDVGALVSEVASDYRQMGVDLSLLAPTAKPASTSRPTSTSPQPGEDLVGANALSGESITSSRGLLNCLILELDMGVVGVSSAGPDCYVIALADPKVPQGMLKARLNVLSSYVEESMSLLTEPF